MIRADDYRRYAAECLTLGQNAKTPQDRARLLEMAHAWNEMAVKAAAGLADGEDEAPSALPWKPPE